MDSAQASITNRSPSRILAVVDWSVDPNVVAETLRARSATEPTEFTLLVPSRLPGLDWVGNPNASRPCATRQLGELERLSRLHGFSFATASIGDPERLPAIRAALEASSASGVLLFEQKRRPFAHPLSLPRRVERSTGLPVESIEVPSRVLPSDATRRRIRRAQRCALAGT
jgi:hypothetical protein